MKGVNLFLCIILILLMIGCAAQTNLEPLGKGNISGNISFGGPIISAFGTKIPVPYVTSGITYGFKDNFNINGSFHLFPLAYKIIGFDAGFSWFPLKNDGFIPTMGLHPSLLYLMSAKSDVDSRLRIYPFITHTATWKVKNGDVFTGYDFMLPITSADYDDDAASFIISPFIGYRFHLGDRTRLITELKWHGANIQSNELAVEYLPISNYGAITTLFSIERSF